MIGGTWDGASFRDQNARVLHHDGRIFRALSPVAFANWRAFSKRPLCATLMTHQALMRTWEVPEGLPGVVPGPVLEHEPLEFPSYAYEWPFFLLKRAAVLQLELLEQLIPEGFILKDGMASNVMFQGIQPVFIDLGSIVPYQEGDVWPGFGEFLQTLLYPLLLSAYKGIPHHAWLRGARDAALPAWQVSKLFRGRDLLRPGILRFVKMGAALDRLAAGWLDVTRNEISASRVPRSVLLKNIRTLKTLVLRLRAGSARRVWIDYAGGAGYDESGQERKRAAVLSALGRLSRTYRLVWDLGCNTGEYSLLAAPRARLTVAIDEDEAVVEEVCRRCESAGVRNVLPLVVDISDPSPAQGWRGVERQSLSERRVPDLVLVLALMHHLVLTKNIRADELIAELARLGQHCLIEHVSPKDPIAQRLQPHLGDGANELPDRTTFETLVSRHFRVNEVTPVTETRTLYLLTAGAAAA